MTTARTTTLGLLVGLLCVLCALTPASADTSLPAATSAPAGPGEPLIVVTGETWSSPAYPVLCRHTSGQVSCTPEHVSEVKPQQCLAGVFMDGGRVTVCTTYEGHVPALESAGGKNLIVQYGCSVGDLVCGTFENWGRGMALTATAAMLLAASAMRFDTSTVLWTAAVGEWSFWQWAVLAVMFGAMAWSIGAAAVSGQRDDLVGAIVRTFIAVPAVPLTLWTTGHLLNAIDDLTWHILNRDGPFGLFTTVQKVMWAGGHANYFFAFLIHGMLLLAMVLLVLVFTFRNIALAALITASPIAWMLFPAKRIGVQWVTQYVAAVVALLLAGPLTIGFLTLIVNGLADVETIWDPQAWPLLLGLVLSAFAPFAVFGLFSFAGGVAADSLGSRLGSNSARLTTTAARSAARLPTRLGAIPAGIPRTGRPPAPLASSSGRVGNSTTHGPRGAKAPASFAPARPAISSPAPSATPQPVPASTPRPERNPS